ncbi:MAG: Chagasin family peptidase inhibitor I42 [Synergistetes bacterium ADurb.Bin520]|nr:MAG: Chagasin family peptidase inhibitor I42 [Synergistetes bacterium ADurb.Bin520]
MRALIGFLGALGVWGFLAFPVGAWGGEIRGEVWKSGGQPLPGVLVRMVRLVRLEGEPCPMARTDDRGSFSLPSPSGGTVTLLVSPDTLPAVRIAGIGGGPGDNVRVDLGYLFARAGEPLSLDLPSNPSTGYGWSLEESGEVPFTAESAFIPPPSSGPRPMVGRGGTERWTFVFPSPGFYSLRLVYARPWEQGKPPARTQGLAVTVAP